MCPIVPMFMCGFDLSNFSLAMVTSAQLSNWLGNSPAPVLACGLQALRNQQILSSSEADGRARRFYFPLVGESHGSYVVPPKQHHGNSLVRLRPRAMGRHTDEWSQLIRGNYQGLKRPARGHQAPQHFPTLSG